MGAASLLFAEAADLISVGQPLVIGSVTLLVIAGTVVVLGVAAARTEGRVNASFAWLLLLTMFGTPMLLMHLDGKIRDGILYPILAGWVAFVVVLIGFMLVSVVGERVRKTTDKAAGPGHDSR